MATTSTTTESTEDGSTYTAVSNDASSMDNGDASTTSVTTNASNTTSTTTVSPQRMPSLPNYFEIRNWDVLLEYESPPAAIAAPNNDNEKSNSPSSQPTTILEGDEGEEEDGSENDQEQNENGDASTTKQDNENKAEEKETKQDSEKQEEEKETKMDKERDETKIENEATTTNNNNNNNDNNNSSTTVTKTKYKLHEHPHVGNNRLLVLLSMHQREYEDSLIAGESTTFVVHKILDIVTQQCEPAGRFLLRLPVPPTNPRDGGVDQYGTHWTVVSPDDAMDFVRQQLELQPSTGPETPFARALNGSQPPGPTAADDDTTTSAMTTETATPNGDEMSTVEPDGEKKRRRRSSLLRRSMSLNDKKKTIKQFQLAIDGISELDFDIDDDHHDKANRNNDGTSSNSATLTNHSSGNNSSTSNSNKLTDRRALFQRSDSNPMFNAPNDKVERAEPLDVIFNVERTRLMSNHTGNNRLLVLLDVRKDGYMAPVAQTKDDESSRREKQTAIVLEIMETVTRYWGGRFLAEKATMAHEDHEFVMLDKRQARVALQTVFDKHIASSSDKGATSTTGWSSDSSTTTSTTTEEKRPSLVKKETLRAIQQIPTESDMQNMRNAALQSLQKRKKRQGLTSKIRNLAATTRTRMSRTKNDALLPPNTNPTAGGGNSQYQMSNQFQQQQKQQQQLLEPLPLTQPPKPELQRAIANLSASCFHNETDITNKKTKRWSHNSRSESNNSKFSIASAKSSGKFSDMSDGMIEDMLSALDVSTAFGPNDAHE